LNKNPHLERVIEAVEATKRSERAVAIESKTMGMSMWHWVKFVDPARNYITMNWQDAMNHTGWENTPTAVTMNRNPSPSTGNRKRYKVVQLVPGNNAIPSQSTV